MKKILANCIVLFFLIGCTNSNQVKEIEILTYFNSAKDYQMYASIEKSGFTQTLFHNETSHHIDNCQSRIRKSLMDSLLSVCKNKKEKDFNFKSTKRILYCGNWHSVKITFENGGKIMFKYPFANKENKQFFPFESLLNQIQKDSLQATRLNIGQLGQLYLKQKELSNVTFKKDSIFNLQFIKKRK